MRTTARLGPRFSPVTAAAAPSVVADLLSIAQELQHPPFPLDPQMRSMFMIKAGERVETLTKRIEIIEPIPAKGAAPKLARIAPRAPAKTAPAGQMSLAL